MSHEYPGDGERCDHCNRTPQQVPSTPDWLLESTFGNGFMHVHNEIICYDCHTRQADYEIAQFVAAHSAVTPRVANGRGSTNTVDLSISGNAMWINGRRTVNYEPLPDDLPLAAPRPTRRRRRPPRQR